MCAFATASSGLCALPPLTMRNLELDMIVTKQWSLIVVSLVVDLSSEPPCTQGVAGSSPLAEQKFAPFSFYYNLTFLKMIDSNLGVFYDEIFVNNQSIDLH